MSESSDGFEFLRALRERNGKAVQNFAPFSEQLAFRAREKGIPVSGQFELTPLCNFSCRMCYVHLFPEQLGGNAILSTDEWRDLIHQAWELGMYKANLTGGECLAYPGFEELFLYLHELGCSVGVLTNGYLLDDDRIRFFVKHTPSIIQITLYGQNDDAYERVTGKRAFSTVADNIRKAKEAHLPVTLSVTPNTFLGEDVMDTIRLAHSLCDSVNINPALFIPREETGRSGQHISPDIDLYLRAFRLINELNGREIREINEENLPPYGSDVHECSECGFQCGGGRSAFVIDWQGTLIPCNRMNMIRGFPLRDGFQKAWASINKEVNNWPRVPECQGCAYEEVCNNCAGNIVQYAEPGKQPIPLCEQTKLFVQHGVWSLPDCED